MRQQIWKFPIEAGESTVLMPLGAEVLTMQIQHGGLNIWAKVNPNAKTEPRSFVVYGTGHDIDPDAHYLGTSQQGPFVWHLFEKRSPR